MDDPNELETLPGVGPVRAARLREAGVADVRDLCLLVPRRLHTVGARRTCAEAAERVGERSTVTARVRGLRVVRAGRRRSLTRVQLEDESGSLQAVFFNQPWIRQAVEVGTEVEVEGRVGGGREVALQAPRIAREGHPLPAPGTLEPEYVLTRGIAPSFASALVEAALERADELLVEPLDDGVLGRLGLPRLADAARALHAPSSEAEFDAARRRVAFGSLIGLAEELAARGAATTTGRAMAVAIDDEAHAGLVARLPHVPTGDQALVLDDLRRELGLRRPMRRLLQGDVGTGKTLCAVYALLAVAASGGQAAFLAPTEILAEQHYGRLRAELGRLGLACVLLTGSAEPSARRDAERRLADGTAQIAFGTHALFSARVRYRRLALAVIDEQHRFGVAQRRGLLDKGRDVHALLLSATPIPRSLALTMYGDLDVSIVRERPAGRGEVATRVVLPADRPALAADLGARLERGEGCLWICPRIETTPSGRGAADAFEVMRAGPFGRFGVGLVHGRLPAEERAEQLERFSRGELGVLVGTTVLEVGIDVARATAVVIEGPERFGLAQLHQLRGRVGRGARDSLCYLFCEEEPSERLAYFRDHADGFEIAEEDLRVRGMGDLAGLRQAGANREGLVDLDVELWLAARELVGRRPTR